MYVNVCVCMYACVFVYLWSQIVELHIFMFLIIFM